MRFINVPGIVLDDEPKILGFDCSSSTIGWGLIVLRDSPVLVSYGHIKPLKSKYNIYVRLYDVHNKIGELCQKIDPMYVVIEDIIFHMKGKSSAKTITTLAIFNRIVGLSVHMHTGIIPELLTVGTIRKIIRSEHVNINPKFKKEDVPGIIRSYLESGFTNIINRNGNISDETYDESDGIIAAWAYGIQLGKNNE